jgi:hypothetical protein
VVVRQNGNEGDRFGSDGGGALAVTGVEGGGVPGGGIMVKRSEEEDEGVGPARQ